MGLGRVDCKFTQLWTVFACVQIDDLPPELLEPVLVEAAVSLQLEAGAYRATLGRVCKRWAAIIDRPSFACEVIRRVRNIGRYRVISGSMGQFCVFG